MIRPAYIGALALLAMVVPALPGWGQQPAADDPGRDAPTVLITGSNRGIGLEFARQYGELGWQVIATCRSPGSAADLQAIAADFPNVVVEQLDITDHAAVDALAERYADRAIDILLNNAALLGDGGKQRFGAIDYELFRRIVEVNSIGTMKVTEAFAPNVIASEQKKIITLGSAAGSIAMIQPPPDFFAYRASKVALHLLMKNVALQLADQGVIVGLINPGLVDTRGFAKIGPDDPVPDDYKQVVALIRSGALQLSTPAEAVAELISLIDELTPQQSGVFLNVGGETLPW